MKRLALVMLAVACGGVVLSGCKSYYENAGMRVRTGSVAAPVEISEPTSSVNVRFLFFLDGVDLYAAKGSDVRMNYCSVSSGSWLSSATTQACEVVVAPCTPRPTAGGGTTAGGAEAPN